MKLTNNKTLTYIILLFCCVSLLFSLTACGGGGGGGGSSIDIGHYFLVQGGFDSTNWKTADGVRTLSFNGYEWTMTIGESIILIP